MAIVVRSRAGRYGYFRHDRPESPLSAEPENRRVAILVLPTTRWPDLAPNAGKIRDAIQQLQPGSYVEIAW
jgi:hypothetical protein